MSLNDSLFTKAEALSLRDPLIDKFESTQTLNDSDLRIINEVVPTLKPLERVKLSYLLETYSLINGDNFYILLNLVPIFEYIQLFYFAAIEMEKRNEPVEALDYMHENDILDVANCKKFSFEFKDYIYFNQWLTLITRKTCFAGLFFAFKKIYKKINILTFS